MEGGGASQVLALSEYADIPLAKTQADLTPLQRMVILKEVERQQEEADNKNPHGGGSKPMMNSHPAAGGVGGMTGETVEYVNEGA